MVDRVIVMVLIWKVDNFNMLLVLESLNICRDVEGNI